MATARKIAPPNLPISPAQYSSPWQEQFSNVLRLFFNQTTTAANSATAYGSFYDTSTQTNLGASATNIMHLSSTVSVFNTSLVDGTSNNAKVYVAESGVYNIQFSAQINKSGGSSSDVYFWLLQNGKAIPSSAGYATLSGGANSKTITAWNYVLPLQANDYVQLAWASADTSITLPTVAAVGAIPASPSLIFTINWVSNVPL